MTRAEQLQTDGYLLWNFLDVNGATHRCEVQGALGFSPTRQRTLGQFLLRETGETVILPSGMMKEPHVSPISARDCRCGTLSVDYSARVAREWHKRRLVTLRGHANSCYEIGAQLAAQFPDSVIQRRLSIDAKRILDDVEIALAELVPGGLL